MSSKPSPPTVWGESKTLGRGGRVHPPGPVGDSNGDQIVQLRVSHARRNMVYFTDSCIRDIRVRRGMTVLISGIFILPSVIVIYLLYEFHALSFVFFACMHLAL
ncbi:hypothetical protein E2C01_063930 [Portunus trituberculatus]|uniref:Uncharacterized protein n=1 Tax=Portunus trituberculatus TaxID=210409 RepID=A0A5B7HIZ6_PORTR|nr:hypothetical protein [Portunus trituberculatus]